MWDVVGLERSLEVVPLARPGGVKGPAKSDNRRLMRKPYTAHIEPTYVSGRLVPQRYRLRWDSINSVLVICAPFFVAPEKNFAP